MRLRILVNFDTGITCAVIGKDGAGCGETIGVLVEDNVTFIFNELRIRPQYDV